jgi:hypothetical protein
MTTCLCGNAIEQEGSLCLRCKSLRILGQDSSATRNDVETSYRLLVKVWHPDRFENDPKLRGTAEETLKSINAAYAYLASIPDVKDRKCPKPKRSTQEVAMQPASRARRRSPFDYGMMTRCGLLVLALAIPALMLVGLDAWLSSNPAIAGFYGPYRSRLLFTLRTNVTEAKQSAEHALHQLSPNLAAANRTSAAQKANPDTTLTSTDSPSTDPIPVPHISMPYVTIGLTRDEVITVMGRPGSSTPDTMRYKTAVFYFNKGLVAGWQVDPTLIPLRVKLWPSGPIDPRLTGFTIGSPRNDVIAVQGTPTMLSENKLAYGGSEIFFEDGRVIGWNDNHGSQRLRIVPR